MYIEQLYTNCLAQAAYYIESDGEAAIIDPLREAEPYLSLLNKRGATLKYIFETHFHADFVSGHLSLAAATGAPIIYGPMAKGNFDILNAADGEIFNLGKIKLKAIFTPGHTPESTSYLLINEKGEEHSIFTGDTLFVGDVGRPDLLEGVIASKEEQLANLYDTLNNKIKPLADHIIVYPGHGPGSACGKSIGKDSQSTIGREKATNYALQPMDFETFSKTILEDQMPAPKYFIQNALINRKGYPMVSEVLVKAKKQLSKDKVEALLSEGAILLDTRPVAEYQTGNIKGSIQVGLDGQFAVWVGTLFNVEQPLIVVSTEDKLEESIIRLARVGFDNILGFVPANLETWHAEGYEVEKMQNITAEEFLTNPAEVILDVRRDGEFKAGHLENVLHIPLRELPNNLAQLSKDSKIQVHCAGGYRSVIALSYLKNKGFEDVTNIQGGFGAIQKAQELLHN